MQGREAVWLFHCPECGFDHRDLGHLMRDDEVLCIVCLEEDGREVRVRRWIEEHPATSTHGDARRNAA